jgi:4-diphosphocytidyl-2-C-methyl-D-erythritol kinase
MSTPTHPPASGATIELSAVEIQAHAKANLFLRVLAREDSGYHSIETLFTLLELCDSLTVERIDNGIELSVEGAQTGPAEQNLAYRAAAMVLEATGRKFGVHVHLNKEIPVRAGLGGGSSDGAATLHAVNRLAGDAVPRHEILQFAAKLGSDVPFLSSGAPLALGWSRGERLFRLPPPAPTPVLVAVPDFGVSTKEAYELLSAGRGSGSRRGAMVLDSDALTNWGGIGRLGGNDFETVLFGREPRLRELFERIAQTAPQLVRVSGSGSAVVGLYKNDLELDNAATEIGEREYRLIKTMTRAQAASGLIGVTE